MLYNAVVAGLGPGGATVAYELAKKGLNVLAFDKEKFPRYKACGGCVSLKVKQILPFDFNAAVEETIDGAVFTYRSRRPIFITSGKTIGYTVNREKFDSLLKEKAREAGAAIKEGERVTGAEEQNGCVIVRTSEAVYRAKVLVAADGANSIISRNLLGLSSEKYAVALEAEIPVEKEERAQLSGKILVDFGCVPYGYAWIFPKRDGLSAGIAGLAEKVRGKIKKYFREFAARENILAGINMASIYGWTIPYFDGGRKIAQGRVAAVGDAAHLVDPFLGEGIYYAIRSGQLAAQVIYDRMGDEKIDLDSYNKSTEAELYPELAAAGRVGDWIYRYPYLWYRILESEPALMEKYYEVVRGEESYGEFYRAIISRVKARPWRLVSRWFRGYVNSHGIRR